LQLTVPTVKTRVPGWKWLNGFFSIGSICIAASLPYEER
jgi:hypothetical protein